MKFGIGALFKLVDKSNPFWANLRVPRGIPHLIFFLSLANRLEASHLFSNLLSLSTMHLVFSRSLLFLFFLFPPTRRSRTLLLRPLPLLWLLYAPAIWKPNCRWAVAGVLATDEPPCRPHAFLKTMPPASFQGVFRYRQTSFHNGSGAIRTSSSQSTRGCPPSQKSRRRWKCVTIHIMPFMMFSELELIFEVRPLNPWPTRRKLLFKIYWIYLMIVRYFNYIILLLFLESYVFEYLTM